MKKFNGIVLRFLKCWILTPAIAYSLRASYESLEKSTPV